ncbi:hypothetical protein MUP79_05505 [Candidatus Bathyarchaeota archaeon]|nr:hypothetical protein [Candidatus Bathyarchaeota archaeon]
MKEQFRNWNYRGNLSVRYKDANGASGVWKIAQPQLLMAVTAILKEYSDIGVKLTNRQLYYQLVAGGIIPNAVAIYKRLCAFLTSARYAGLIDWDAIEDRGRVPTMHSEWDNVQSLIDSAIRSYRLPRWSDQDYYVELYCEKQAMESVLKPVADQFHIYFGYNKGYASASSIYDLSKRIKEKIVDGKKTIVLYFGDHDSSGLDMIRDIRERVTEFLLKGQDEINIDLGEEEGWTTLDEESIDEYFQVVPLALNMAQIKQYNPPPNPAKMTDPRAEWYVKEYGHTSWELDALKPDVLVNLATEGILKYLDYDKYESWKEKENLHKDKLKKFGAKLDNGDAK